ncbi:MAG TPA: flagellar assembly protein FliW [Arthrobacter sp.]
MTGLTFVAPPLGLDPLTEFNLETLDGSDGLYALQAVDAELRMFLLDPVVFIPGYNPELTDDQASALKLASPDDAAMFVIANHRDGATTVNLLAPIIVNTVTDMCAQFILEGQDWPIQAPLGV